jgi:hypothetical protein
MSLLLSLTCLFYVSSHHYQCIRMVETKSHSTPTWGYISRFYLDMGGGGQCLQKDKWVRPHCHLSTQASGECVLSCLALVFSLHRSAQRWFSSNLLALSNFECGHMCMGHGWPEHVTLISLDLFLGKKGEMNMSGQDGYIGSNFQKLGAGCGSLIEHLPSMHRSWLQSPAPHF